MLEIQKTGVGKCEICGLEKECASIRYTFESDVHLVCWDDLQAIVKKKSSEQATENSHKSEGVSISRGSSKGRTESKSRTEAGKSTSTGESQNWTTDCSEQEPKDHDS